MAKNAKPKGKPVRCYTILLHVIMEKKTS